MALFLVSGLIVLPMIETVKSEETDKPASTETTIAKESAMKIAGTYRIDDWEALESGKLRHFFYLHPAGFFLLAAEWPGNETSEFVGHWRLEGELVLLNGKGWVETNQGEWKTPYLRSFQLGVGDGGEPLLKPVLEKNRFGLMGWPNSFLRHSGEPEVNLIQAKYPDDAPELLKMIQELITKSG